MDYSSRRRFAPGGLTKTILLAMTLGLVGGVAAGCRPQAAGGASSSAVAGGGGRLESAEELYKQGRAIEDRVATSPQNAQANLQAARTAYIRALGANPSPRLEAYIRAGIGNVAFYQDDYQTAVQQFAAAYEHLDDPNLKAMTLLRLGMAQQRLGRFEQADRTFLTLQQQFPQSTAAQASRGKFGARQFYVQLAVFSQSSYADKAVLKLRQEGFTPNRQTDIQGRQVIRVGPLATYAQAVAARNRLAGTYPQAFIEP